MSQPEPAVHVRELMSRMANGVTIVTTEGPGGRYGMTVSSVCSVSLDPPTMLVCLSHRSPLGMAVALNDLFVVNVLARHQAWLAERFAGREGPAGYSFDTEHWDDGPTGAPTLREAVAAFECTVTHTTSMATHRIVVGKIETCGGHSTAPLVYAHRTFGRYLGGTEEARCAVPRRAGATQERPRR